LVKRSLKQAATSEASKSRYLKVLIELA